MNRTSIVFLCLWLADATGMAQPVVSATPDKPWPAAKAWAWYEKTGVIKGVNYVPSTAVNLLEWWQADTFDPKTIDRELGFAHNAGYNSVRANLSETVWEADPSGLKKRLDTFLELARKHQITVMLCLFDDVNFAKANPQIGPQAAPKPHIHNSRWVPSPHPAIVTDQTRWPILEKYVKDIVGTFGQDSRVLIWDLYNEPGNGGLGMKSMPLAEATFGWARAMHPRQPLTTGPWVWYESAPNKRLYALSDVVTFHWYNTAVKAEKLIQFLQSYDRPILCTETIRRQPDLDYADMLPIYAKYRVGWYNWGLVAGKQQTYLPWEDTTRTINDPWHWDMLYPDGRPYRPAEVALIRAFRFQPALKRESMPVK